MPLHGLEELNRRECAEGPDQDRRVPGPKLVQEDYQGPAGLDPLQAQYQLRIREPRRLTQLTIGLSFLRPQDLPVAEHHIVLFALVG